MENILYWMVVGVIAGWLAKIVVPGEGPGGILGDFIVGIVGAVAGGFLFNSMVGRSDGGLMGSIAVSFIGAVVLLTFLRIVIGGRVSFGSNLKH